MKDLKQHIKVTIRQLLNEPFYKGSNPFSA
jgi:hypothetical protein